MQFIVDVETTLRKTSFMKQLKDEDESTFTHIQYRDLFRDVLINIRDKGKGLTEARKYIFTEMKSTMTARAQI